jgi:hypothetical protein
MRKIWFLAEIVGSTDICLIIPDFFNGFKASGMARAQLTREASSTIVRPI